MSDRFALVRDNELRDYIEALYAAIHDDEIRHHTLARAAGFLADLREQRRNGNGAQEKGGNPTSNKSSTK